MRVSQEVMEVLDKSRVVGRTLCLPPGQLDRALYSATNKVIEAAGGKWSRKDKCHTFDGDAAETIDPILESGEYSRTKQDLGQFDTPNEVAMLAVKLAGIAPAMKVLEPSAGIGRLVDAAEVAGGDVWAYEIDAKRAAVCKRDCALHGGIITADFLSAPVAQMFDVVLMNPPFAKQADIDHVMHAVKYLKPGGRLVAIMSAGVLFRTNAKTEAFRAFLNSHGASCERLDEGAFKASGTMVNTVIVCFNK